MLTAHKTILCAVIRTDSVVLLSSHNMVYSVEINKVAMVRENIWKLKFFPGQGKDWVCFGLPGIFRKDLKSQGI